MCATHSQIRRFVGIGLIQIYLIAKSAVSLHPTRDSFRDEIKEVSPYEAKIYTLIHAAMVKYDTHSLLHFILIFISVAGGPILAHDL